MASHSVLSPPAAYLSRLARPLQLPSLHAPWRRCAAFSTTAHQCKRKTKDNNKKRGVSSLYRSGPREHLSMSDVPLPKPRDYKPKVSLDESHGLWGFFPAPAQLMMVPSEAEAFGRAWTVEELRKKSWEDLHSLWWVCCKERNMLATSTAELARAKLGFGEREFEMRDEEVKKTMRRIKHTLTERFYLWQDAKDVAKSDPEIDLEAGNGKAYRPSETDEVTQPNSWLMPEGAEEEPAAPAEKSGDEQNAPGR